MAVQLGRARGRLRKLSAWKDALSRGGGLSRLPHPGGLPSPVSMASAHWAAAGHGGWLMHQHPRTRPIVATTTVNHRITQSKPSVPRSLYLSLLRLACIFVFLLFSSPHCNHLIERVEPPWVVSSLPPCLRISSHYRLVSRLQRPPFTALSSFISLQVRVGPSRCTAPRPHRPCLPSSPHDLFLAVTHARLHDR